MSNARNERRKRNRQHKDAGRMVQGSLRNGDASIDVKSMPDFCACWGVRNGETQYAVRPALCGHWFVMHGDAATGKLWCGPLRKKPIRSVKRGAGIPMKATVKLSMKLTADQERAIQASDHALRNAAVRRPIE